MYRTWSVPKGGHEDSVFVIRIEYGLQPYKEEMLFKGSGSMKMNDEEIKKYTEAISKNSDNLFVCPYRQAEGKYQNASQKEKTLHA